MEVFSQREESSEEVFSTVYQELRQVARAYMRRERPDHTLQATALVNEAYMRLFEGEPFRAKSAFLMLDFHFSIRLFWFPWGF